VVLEKAENQLGIIDFSFSAAGWRFRYLEKGTCLYHLLGKSTCVYHLRLRHVAEKPSFSGGGLRHLSLSLIFDSRPARELEAIEGQRPRYAAVAGCVPAPLEAANSDALHSCLR
jgi:hypothetical protein